MMTCVLKFGPQGRGRMNWILPLHATLNFFGFSTARRQFLCHLAGRRSTGGRFGGAARSGGVGLWTLDLGLGTWYLNHYLIILVDSWRMVV